MREGDFPAAPPFSEAREAYFGSWGAEAQPHPPVQGEKVVHGNGGPKVIRSVTGYWLYLVPKELWWETPQPVKVALTMLYEKGGYRSIPEIMEAQMADLLGVSHVGEQRLGVLFNWFYVRGWRRSES